MGNVIHRGKGSFTHVENTVFFDRELSLKAKGIYCQIRSLEGNPEWVFTIRGFASLVKDGVDSVSAGIKELDTVEGIKSYELDNGLKIVLFADQSKPTATVNTTYLVGSRMENYGETGMAHLLEHLMFKGSKNYPDPTKEFTRRGFRMNGTTWLDRTNYFVSFTANDDNMRWALGWSADAMVNSFIAKKDLDTEMTVVRNEYEQGGMPCWVKNNDGTTSLQIVEYYQINNNPDIVKMFKMSTHFNPVDLVCATRDASGRHIDLIQFVDENTGFISEKSAGGRPLRAMERPGLWNGAMAGWNTVFIEVPPTTFTPVKVVADLLSAPHINV